VPCDLNSFNLLLFSTATVFVLVLLPLGFSVAGFYQSATLVGRYYTQFIVAHIQTSFALAMSVLPFVVWQLVPNKYGF
jgi:hypothetical protein